MKNQTIKQKIPITENVRKKLLDYVRLVGQTECYGLLLAPIDVNDGIIYNAILAPSQRVSSASAGIDENGAAAAKAEIENMGYKSIGFWHSHCNFGTFHSGVDDNNLDDLLLDFAGNTEKLTERKREIKGYYIMHEDNGLHIFLPFKKDSLEIKVKTNNEEVSIKKVNTAENMFWYDSGKKELCVIQNNEMLNVKGVYEPIFRLFNMKGEKIKGTGTAYSIVVNKKQNFYGEIAEAEWCYSCGGIETKKIRNVPVVSIEVEKDIQFTEQEILREIGRKIK
jgi:hypothetical protein